MFTRLKPDGYILSKCPINNTEDIPNNLSELEFCTRLIRFAQAARNKAKTNTKAEESKTKILEAKALAEAAKKDAEASEAAVAAKKAAEAAAAKTAAAKAAAKTAAVRSPTEKDIKAAVIAGEAASAAIREAFKAEEAATPAKEKAFLLNKNYENIKHTEELAIKAILQQVSVCFTDTHVFNPVNYKAESLLSKLTSKTKTDMRNSFSRWISEFTTISEKNTIIDAIWRRILKEAGIKHVYKYNFRILGESNLTEIPLKLSEQVLLSKVTKDNGNKQHSTERSRHELMLQLNVEGVVIFEIEKRIRDDIVASESLGMVYASGASKSKYLKYKQKYLELKKLMQV
jgi:hypothetical protein